MTIEPAWMFTCDEDDCGETEFMADCEGSGPPMEWTEDEAADQHRCGACSKQRGALSFGSFEAETAAITGKAT
jgi:hypothetical protein